MFSTSATTVVEVIKKVRDSMVPPSQSVFPSAAEMAFQTPMTSVAEMAFEILRALNPNAFFKANPMAFFKAAPLLMQRTPPPTRNRGDPAPGVSGQARVERERPGSVQVLVAPRDVTESEGDSSGAESRPTSPRRRSIGSVPSNRSLVFGVFGVLASPVRSLTNVASTLTLEGSMLEETRHGVSSWDVVLEAGRATVKGVSVTHPAGQMIIWVKVGAGSTLAISSTLDSQVRISAHYVGATTGEHSFPTSLGRSEFIVRNAGKTRSTVRFTVMNYATVKFVPAPSLQLSGDVEENPGPGPPKKLTLEELYQKEADELGLKIDYLNLPKHQPTAQEIAEAEHIRKIDERRAEEAKKIWDSLPAGYKEERSKAAKAVLYPADMDLNAPREYPSHFWKQYYKHRHAPEDPRPAARTRIVGGKLVYEYDSVPSLTHKEDNPPPSLSNVTDKEKVEVQASSSGGTKALADLHVAVQVAEAIVSEEEESPECQPEQPGEPSPAIELDLELTQAQKSELRKQAHVKSPMSNYYAVVCRVVGVPVSNSFAELCCLDDLPDQACPVFVEIEELVQIDTPEKPTPAPPRRKGTPREDSEPKQVRKPTPPNPEKTREEKAQQKRAVLNRIAKKIQSGGSTLFQHWLLDHRPTKDFVEHVMRHMFRAQWRYSRQYTEIHLMAEEYIDGGLPTELWTMKLLSLTTQYAAIALACPNTAALLAESKLHNKRMHAYNGNTQQVINSMRDVNDAPDARPIFMAEAEVAESFLRDSVMAASMGLIWGDRNQKVDEYFDMDRIGFPSQGSNNQTSNVLKTLGLPCTSLIPRAFGHRQYNPAHWLVTEEMARERKELATKAKRHNEAVSRLNSKAGQTMSKNARRKVEEGILTAYGAKTIPVPSEFNVGDPIDETRGQHATTRLKVWETQALTVPGTPIALTVRSGNIEEQKQRDTGLSLKKGTISLDGFTNPDIVSVASDTSYSGLCLEQPCLRLSLFLEIKTWAFGWECIPQYAMTLFDPNVIGEKVDLTPRINCSPIPGEQCGGQARPEYPFGGGSGSVRIHTSLLSVSEDRRACAIYLPNTILDSIQDASRVVAIMLIALTEWPFCLYGYDVVSRPKNGGEAMRGTERYTNHNISAASLVHVPGLRNIDLILPAIVSDGSTGGQANARPRWTVRAGPAGTARLAPYEQLHYCYARPNHDFPVPLTDFLVSWAAELSHDDVYRVISKLGATFPMMAPMAAMRDVMVLSCYMYPKLTLGLQNENPEPYQTNDEGEFDTKVLLDYTSAACVSPAVVKGDFPLQDSYQGHLLIQAFDYTAFNQVMLGLAAPEIGDQKRFAQISPEICHRGVILCNIGRSAMYSMPWNLALQYLGATSKAWLTHRQTMVSRWIPYMLQLWFGSMSMAADESLAPSGYVYSNLLSMALDVRPTTIHWTFETGAKRPVSVYDRLMFTGDMATVYDVDGVEYDGYVPVTLVDGWIQNLAYVLPKGWVPFAPPSRLGAPLAITNTEFTGGKRLKYLEEAIDGALHNSPMLLPPFDLYYETGRVPRRIDVERWNTRLFLTDTEVPPKITDKNGVLIPGTSAEGKLPCARINYLKHGEEYPPEQLAQASMCFPTVDDQGRMAFVMLPKARADSISCSAVGSGYVNRAIFLRIWSMPSLPNPSSEVVEDELAAKILQVNLGFRIAKPADVGSTTGSAPPVPPSAEQASLDASTPQ